MIVASLYNYNTQACNRLYVSQFRKGRFPNITLPITRFDITASIDKIKYN